MRHGKTFSKRLLTFVLSIAMILTSVNVPVLTVQATAATDSENSPGGGINLPSNDGYEDNDLGKIQKGEEISPNTEVDSSLAKPVGLVVNPPEIQPNGSVTVAWDGSNLEGGKKTSEVDGWQGFKVYLDNNPVDGISNGGSLSAPSGSFSEGSHTVGLAATYTEDRESEPITATFTVKASTGGDDGGDNSQVKPLSPNLNPSEVAPNGSVTVAWDTSYVDLNGSHVSIDTIKDKQKGWKIYLDDESINDNASSGVQITAPSEPKNYTVGLAITYNDGSESPKATATLIVKGEGGGETPGPGDTETKAPAAPSGVVAGYWDTEDTNKGKIKVEWNSMFGDGGTPTSWEVKIDNVIVGTENAVAAYFYENIYDAGTHNVEVVAINSIGRSPATTVQFTLTADQAGSTDGEATEEDIAKLRTLYNSEKATAEAENTKYTTATWNAYTKAFEEAGEILKKFNQASQEEDKPTKKEVNTAYQNLVLAKQNLKEKDPEAKTEVLISEQEAQAFVGSKVTLKSVADSSDFTFGTDYTVTINGEAKTSGVTIKEEGSGKATIELDSSLFTSAGTYKIQFSKSNAEISPVYQVVYAVGSSDNWTLKWQDEFEGTSLNMSKWDYQTGNGSAYNVSGWGNDEEQIYTNSNQNTSVADGKLTITAKKESTGGYTSARLRTVTEDIDQATGKANTGEDLWAAAYGKVEAKIKMPAGQGIWPAFWLLPYDSEYGTWAASGEIDIMEARGRLPGEVCGTIHYGGAWPANSSSGKTYYFDAGDTIKQYHIYTIEWDPTEMRWYVDGNLYSTLNNWYSVESESGNYPYPAPFDEEFYVLLNMAVGGSFDSGATTIEVDENGVDMDVDYVRWYQRPQEEYDNWDITQPEPDKDNSSTVQELLQMHENGNFIKDSDFSAMNTSPITNGDDLKIERGSWKALLIPGNGNGSATWSKTQNDGKNYLKVNVTNAGSQTYSSQMLQYFPVVKGYSYKISYTAYTEAASQKADVSLKIGGDDDNGWGVYSGNYTDQLTTTPTVYTHSFLMSSDTDPTARFEFNLATSTGTVYLTDVRVEILQGGISEDEGQDDDKEPLGDGNHVYNGGFSNGSDSLLYWHWTNNDDPTKVKVVKENKERRAYITASSGSPVSLWQFGMNMLQDDNYKLTFDIESDAQQDIGLKVTNKDGTEVYAQNNGGSDPKRISQGSSTVTWEFTQPKGKTDTSAKLELTFNGSAKIDNVKLIRTTYNNVDYDNVDLYPLYNGDFTNGTDGWNIWHEGAGWEVHYINDEGQLELYPVAVGAGATYYCVGIQSSSMTLTRGVKYKVDFDYWLDADKTYTLELGATQREITLDAGKNHYTSDEFNGSGTGQFTLYLGPYPATDYKLRLDNIVVSAILPEKEGYAQPVNLGQSQKALAGSPVVVDYAGDMATDWENAEPKTYYLKGEKISSEKVKIDKNNNTLTIDGDLFPEEGVYSFYVKAEGYVATKAINLNVLDTSGNLLVNSSFSDGTTGWGSHFLNGCGNFSVNDDGVAVIAHNWDEGSSWDIQIWQDLEYTAGNYIVEFDAWADVARPIHVQMLTGQGGQAIGSMNSYVTLSTAKKNYKVVWKGVADSNGSRRFDIEFGSMTYNGLKSPNDGYAYNIYMDNIKFRPLTQEDLDSMPFDITTAVGAGKIGESLTVTYTGESESTKWKPAKKTVYVNGVAVDDSKVNDNHDTGFTIDGSVFSKAGRYSIYAEVEGFEETNTIYKNIIGADDNRIFGGDMNDASQWVVYDEDAANLSSGRIARGIYSLNYTAGYYHDKWNCWVTWSSQLKKENISVEGGVPFKLRFEASTDLTGGRDIDIEYGKAGVDGNPKETVHVEKGDLKVYEVEITPTATLDDFYVNFLLGPVDSKLETDQPVPHTLQIDNVTLRPTSKDDDVLKAELTALIEEYDELAQGEYTKESWDAFTEALQAAKETAGNESATSDQIAEAINNLKRAYERLTPPTDSAKAELKDALDEYNSAVKDDGSAAYKEYEKARKYAEEIYGDDTATLQEIEDALAALKEAYQNYEEFKKAEAKKKLEEALNKYVAEDDGSDEYGKYVEACENAQEVMGNPAATLQEIEDALDKLEKAYQAYEQLKIAKAREKLEAALDEYTIEDDGSAAYQEYANVYNQAKNVCDDQEATLEAIEAAITSLETAYQKYMDTKAEAKVKLQEALEKYAVTEEDSDAYREYVAVYSQAKSVYDNQDATLQAIENALTALEEAYQQYMGTKLAEAREKLNDALYKYAVEDDGSAAYQEYAKVYKHAEEVRDNEKATLQEIESAIAELEKAYAAYKESVKPAVPETGLYIDPIDNEVYTGAAITPGITVYFNGEELDSANYKVSYSNNKNASVSVDADGNIIGDLNANKLPTVKVTGKGNFSGSATANFKILPKNIGDEVDITAPEVYAVIKNNKVTQPNVTVKLYNKTKLSKNKDYTVATLSDEVIKDTEGNIKPGSYAITITGIGNYTGTRDVDYEILKSDIVMMSKVKVTLSPKSVDYKPNNETERPTLTVTYGSGTLTENKEFTTDWSGDQVAGKATITLTGEVSEGYYGTKAVTYTVNGTALKANKLDITGIEKSYPYTGEDIEPIPVVKDKNKLTDNGDYVTLERGTDYDVTYEKNLNQGTAKVNIIGMNGYTGKVTKTFKIDKIDLAPLATVDSVTVDSVNELTVTYDSSAYYKKTGAQPENITLSYNGIELQPKTDYTISYSNNKKVQNGIASFKITGKGNYKGNFKRIFDVKAPTAAMISADIEITATDLVKPASPDKLKPSVKLVEKSTGKTLSAGTDYIKVTYKDCTKGGIDVTETVLEFNDVITVCVELKGNYVEDAANPPKLTQTFRLYDSTKKASTFKVEGIDKKGYEYTGAEIKPEITVYNKQGEKLELGDDYRINYDKNVDKGTAKIIITGCGNGYGGTKTVNFKITAKKVEWAELPESIANFLKNLF